MDLKSPGPQGTYVDFVRDKLKYLGKKEMSSYFLRDITYTQEMVEEGNMFNMGSYVQCKITLGRRLLSVMTTVCLTALLLNVIGQPFFFESAYVHFCFRGTSQNIIHENGRSLADLQPSPSIF